MIETLDALALLSIVNAAATCEKRNERKRTISQDEDNNDGLKKSKLDEPTDKIEEITKEPTPPQTLFSLPQFLKDKHLKGLTRADLEEFCLQKMCEAICHKSEMSEIHHQVKLQEVLIEAMRKELQQVTKQCRDLDIVNKKLLNDLKNQNVTNKPLTPLKVTRSVGLQVKLVGVESNAKKKLVSSNLPQKSNNLLLPTNKNRNIPNTPNAASPTKQAVSPQKNQVAPKPNTPILSQVLLNQRQKLNEANNRIPPQQTVKPLKQTTDPKNSSTASFIDLTDDDDKRNANTSKVGHARNYLPNSRPNINARPNTLKQNGYTIPLKLTSPVSTSAGVTNPQVMYVMQSNSAHSPNGQKALFLNLQPTNGVLTPTLNGSTVSVIPKAPHVQLKSQSIPKINKPLRHPAPLPPPPQSQVANGKILKPIPPKPHLTIRKTDNGIVLQWKMPYELSLYEDVASYQLYAYQETTATPNTDMWRRVGDVKALALPMACTLTQFADKNKYYFAVRPVDIHKRIGSFSEPEEITL